MAIYAILAILAVKTIDTILAVVTCLTCKESTRKVSSLVSKGTWTMMRIRNSNMHYLGVPVLRSGR